MHTIKLIASDVDGVLLEDTYSPMLRGAAQQLNLEYTREMERNMLSQRREEAVMYMFKQLNVEGTPEEGLQYFQAARANYLQSNQDSHGVIAGVFDFLDLVTSLGVKLVCYGGLAESNVTSKFDPCKKYFERYVCTNDFRPGLKEITKDIYGLEFSQVLFIDDVNTVAEVAKELNIPFIGVPCTEFQREDMIATGVKYMVNSVKEIDRDLLEKIDADARQGTVWTA